MTEYDRIAGPPAAGAQLAAATAAARERQSHVRHELRAPLAVIYPLLSLLRGDDEPTGPQQEYLAVLERNVARLEALIAGTVDSGWADCSSAAPVPEEIALVDVAQELVALRRTEQAEGAPVRIDAGAPAAPRVWADRADVRQILTDLVRNATAYTPASGRVTINARGGASGTVVVEVADTGPGLPPEELGRVFEFGFRGDLARELKVPGLGAGLWVCRELARRNGGDVALTSEPGTGVTATIILPAAQGGSA